MFCAIIKPTNKEEMPDIWQQFHSLPKAIRDGVASPAAIAAVDAIEAEYPDLNLADFIMRVVVHEFPVAELATKMVNEQGLTMEAAKKVVLRLRQEVFTGVVADYLGLKTVPPSPAPTPRPVAANMTVPKASTPVPPRPPANLPVVPPPASTPSTPLPPRPAITNVSPSPIMPLRPTVPLQPSAPVGTAAPTTHYSDADAAEIDAQIAHVKQLTAVYPNQDFDTIARGILTKQNLAFSDELLDRRSIAIMKARLKSVRTTDETREVLMRDVKIGGLGLDQEIAASLATAAEAAATELKTRGMIRLPDQPLPPPPPVVPKVSQVKPEPKPPFRQTGSIPNPPIPNVTDAPRASRPIVRPVDIPAPAPLPAAKPIPVVTSAPPVVTRARQADRPTVADIVRPTTQALGPAEELRSMSLLDFRRLGQGAGESSRRILDKLEHLKRESFAVWAESVRGWRGSEVMQLYLTMGRESLEQGAPISQIITTRTRQGQPYLSEHEFTILADLNRQLQS